MDDLISRSALLEVLENLRQRNPHSDARSRSQHYSEITSCIHRVIMQPTVDAVPVVHGEWERIPYSFVGGYRCSCCGQKSLEKTFNFCGNCGADMRKKVQE